MFTLTLALLEFCNLGRFSNIFFLKDKVKRFPIPYPLLTNKIEIGGHQKQNKAATLQVLRIWSCGTSLMRFLILPINISLSTQGPSPIRWELWQYSTWAAIFTSVILFFFQYHLSVDNAHNKYITYYVNQYIIFSFLSP